MRRRSLGLALTGVVTIAAAGGYLVMRPESSAAETDRTAATTSTATVERRTLVATTPVDGTLGYRGEYPVATVLQRPGSILTGVAPVGSVVPAGETLYTVDGTVPVALMLGDMPAWRDLGPSVPDGRDVEQLERNLRDLDFASSSLVVDEKWDDETTAAVKRWQDALGVAETGEIPLGAIVFAPGPMRITAHSANLGQILQAGTPILVGSSTDPVVTVALDPALQTQVRKGDPVSVTLPDGQTIDGRVSAVATVATARAGGEGVPGSGQEPSIAVEVSLDDPSAAGGLDEAPVSVNIETATATDVLAVPVGALVLTLDGTYAVQVEENGQLRDIPVQLGLFAGGWVEVTATGLDEGQRVVVAA